jgi:hypothetical protein
MWEPQPLATLRASTACTEITKKKKSISTAGRANVGPYKFSVF